MNAALTERLVYVARAARDAGHGKRGAIYDAACAELGMSRATLLRRLKEVSVTDKRKKRADAGRSALTRDEAALISATLREATRKNGKRLYSIADAVETLRANGFISAGRTDETTGEFFPLSEDAISRALRNYGLHPEQLDAPAPYTEVASLHPNHVWQIDASLCTLYYLSNGHKGLQVMDSAKFYKNKPANLARIASDRVWSYEITDHASGWIYVEYVTGAESGENLCSVLINAMQERGGADVLHGVPKILYLDPGSANTAGWQRVGKDPSGSPFNSLVQLEMEQGIPRNPFINAGALVVCDMLQGRLSAPRQRMLEVARALCGVSDITYDATVARSEFEHSARNAAIAWLMKSFGNFHHDVPTVLQNYFHYCALKMSCMELARTFVFLANQGEAFHLDEPVVTPMQARQINALMATSGMYQNAGEFAWRVGLPAKSGVGGGIVAIVPHEMAIAVWSPELDPAGNSLAGIAALEQLTQTLGRLVY
ncbi:TPA_asm: glutaminase [Salmonella enterica subsp. enterica serovar Typhi str. CT18]|uniref:Glutaminase n=1 Tax=Salmonella enterica subsp. enterica serovar Typhi str. CT18 TaxID=220341 RepID=A0A714UMR7_SALTI|nr:glutaminase [Salmonella enterica subsp. enterica serovar Typhi str. CT18]